jgi:DNA-binding response OmpR family regulator
MSNHMTTILLVDDDVELCRSMKELLARYGFDSLILHQGSEVESTLRTKKNDLIILDLL